MMMGFKCFLTVCMLWLMTLYCIVFQAHCPFLLSMIYKLKNRETIVIFLHLKQFYIFILQNQHFNTKQRSHINSATLNSLRNRQL
ncbi:hypothetical protein FKM82_004049 [Ascaphus truei]